MKNIINNSPALISEKDHLIKIEHALISILFCLYSLKIEDPVKKFVISKLLGLLFLLEM